MLAPLLTKKSVSERAVYATREFNSRERPRSHNAGLRPSSSGRVFDWEAAHALDGGHALCSSDGSRHRKQLVVAGARAQEVLHDGDVAKDVAKLATIRFDGVGAEGACESRRGEQ